MTSPQRVHDVKSLHDVLSPYSMHGWAGLVHDGLLPGAAFDAIAERAVSPDVQAVVQRLAATAAGRHTLTILRKHWAELGLPPPWDNVLELPT